MKRVPIKKTERARRSASANTQSQTKVPLNEVRNDFKPVLAKLSEAFANAKENEIPQMIWDLCDAVDAGLSRQLKGNRSGLILARIRGIASREKLKTEEGGHISASEAAKRMSVSRPTLAKLYSAGGVIGWKDGKNVRFPVWQFGKSGLLPGMAKILKKLRRTSWNEDWARMLFFLSERGSLGGKRPLDLLRKHDFKAILILAEWEE